MPKDPWEKPDTREIKLSAKEEIYTAVGNALSNWALIENTLLLIFCRLLRATDGESWYTPYKLFGHMNGASIRLEYMRVAGAAMFLNDPLRLAYLNKVLGLVRSFLPRRNDLAHGVTIDYGDGKGFLETPHFASKELDFLVNKEGYRYNAETINEYGLSFTLLGLELLTAEQLLFDNVQDSGARNSDTPLALHLQPAKDNLRNFRNTQPSLPSPEVPSA